MPSVKSKRSHQKVKHPTVSTPVVEDSVVNKRRLATEVLATQTELDLEKVVVIDVNSSPKESLNKEPHLSATVDRSQVEAEFVQSSINEEDKVKISFPGDQWVKKGFPQVFDVTETIVNEWLTNGKFETLPIHNPFIRYAAKTSLQKAKQVETQVLESPVTEKVITKLFEVGYKAQTTIDEIREKLKSKTP